MTDLGRSSSRIDCDGCGQPTPLDEIIVRHYRPAGRFQLGFRQPDFLCPRCKGQR